MGKQTTKILKTKARKICSLYPDRFSKKFEENKKVIEELGLFGYSKSDKNMVAGFITKLKTVEARE
ncbi:MAG: 30S ribosomal protein S17e [Candidatus Diapherotrites archaeon]|nr:30S ribosomal protein S17e [Candidatus Diapherotrites archaeon]